MRPARYARGAGVVTRAVEDSIFLITRTRIEYLAPSAALIWRELAKPKARAELYAGLKAAYPHVSPQRLSADIARFLRQLERHRLIKIREGGTN